MDLEKWKISLYLTLPYLCPAYYYLDHKFPQCFLLFVIFTTIIHPEMSFNDLSLYFFIINNTFSLYVHRYKQRNNSHISIVVLIILLSETYNRLLLHLWVKFLFTFRCSMCFAASVENQRGCIFHLHWFRLTNFWWWTPTAIFDNVQTRHFVLCWFLNWERC